MHENFRQFLDNLRDAGELVDLKQPIDIRHIATLVDQSDKATPVPQRDRLRLSRRVRHHPLAESAR